MISKLNATTMVPSPQKRLVSQRCICSDYETITENYLSLINLQSFRGCEYFQFLVRVRDNRQPEREANATILIKVNRNNALPEFQGEPYLTILSENKNIDGSVFTVRARDRDIQVHPTRIASSNFHILNGKNPFFIPNYLNIFSFTVALCYLFVKEVVILLCTHNLCCTDFPFNFIV